MELGGITSIIEGFLAELEGIYEEGVLADNADLGWERLDRWKRRVSRFLEENVSDEEAQGFQGGVDDFTDLGEEIDKCKNSLVALLEELGSHPDTVIARSAVRGVVVPVDRKTPSADDQPSAVAADVPKKATLSWLWENVPVGVWWLLITVLFIVFVAGVYFGNYPTVREVLRTRTGHPRDLAPPQSPLTGEVRTRPAHLETELARNPPSWIRFEIFWLEKEADDLKRNNLVRGYMVCPVESQQLGATPDFHWVVRATPGYEISGSGYRQTSVQSSNLFEPLIATPTDSSLIRFAVPPCEKGDRLLAVIRISWMQAAVPQDCLSTIQSSVER